MPCISEVTMEQGNEIADFKQKIRYFYTHSFEVRVGKDENTFINLLAEGGSQKA